MARFSDHRDKVAVFIQYLSISVIEIRPLLVRRRIFAQAVLPQ